MSISKKESLERQKKVIKVAFELFVEHSIEAISFKHIADAAGIGIASVFRYHESKADLVIAVSGYFWKDYLKKVEKNRPVEFIQSIPAIERLEYTLDLYIDMYKNRKDLLKFNDNFNHYITHEEIPLERLTVYTNAVNPMLDRLHWMYEKGKEDKTIRTDIPEDEFIRSTAHTMMAACHHYANGFIWGADKNPKHDYTPELLILKEMILQYARGTEVKGK